MGRPKRSTCTQYARSPVLNKAVNTGDIEKLNSQFSEVKNTLKEMKDNLESLMRESLSKISANNKEIQLCNNNIKELLRQTSNVQRLSLEKYIIIISYEKVRNTASYCTEVLSRLKVDRQDVIGTNVIFSNGDKVIYKVELANKFIVNHVLRTKISLRGSPIFIHRPYTDAEKATRSKQIKQAKMISKDKKFRLLGDKLFIDSCIYQWSEIEETYNMCKPLEIEKFQSLSSKESTLRISEGQVAQGEIVEPCCSKGSIVKDSGFLIKTLNQDQLEKNNSDSDGESVLNGSSSQNSYADSSDNQEYQDVLGAEMREAMEATFEERYLSKVNNLRKSIEEYKQTFKS